MGTAGRTSLKATHAPCTESDYYEYVMCMRMSPAHCEISASAIACPRGVSAVLLSELLSVSRWNSGRSDRIMLRVYRRSVLLRRELIRLDVYGLKLMIQCGIVVGYPPRERGVMTSRRFTRFNGSR